MYEEGSLPDVFGYLKKIIAIILAIFLTYSLSSGICLAQPSKITSLSNQKQKDKPAKFGLAIPDFTMLGGVTRYDIFKRALPELIVVGLIENEMVKYVPRWEFWRRATRKFAPDQLQKNPAMIFNDEILDELKINLLLRGEFFEYRGKIRFKATLTDRRGEKIADVSSKILNVREIYFRSGTSLMN